MSATYTPEMAHAAVARGAAWLDEKCPDWFKEINLERLNLASPTFCVLGQTARCLLSYETPNGHAMRGGYSAVVLSDENRDLEVYDLGFNASSWSGDEVRAEFEMLTIAWRQLILERLGTPVSA